METFIHNTADVSDKAEIGEGTKIWHQAQVRENVKIGKQCILGKNVYIDKDVVIGNSVKIQNNSCIYNAVIEDDSFIGPGVLFTNDMYPRAITKDGRLQTEEDWVCIPTLVKRGASIGSAATLMAGITVGENAIVGAGSLVTKDVPPNTIVAGNPAKKLREIE